MHRAVMVGPSWAGGRFFGDEDGSGPEPYLGEELSEEHEIAEGGEELTGAPAVCAVSEEDGFHGGIGPSRSTGSSPRG